MALHAELELLEAIERKAHGAALAEQAGQRHVVGQQRHILAAEGAAQIGEMAFQVRDGVARAGGCQDVGDRLQRVCRRLHAEY